MKQFFEQYGGVTLGILALLVLIAMITPVGNIIKTSLQGTVQTFSTKMESQTDTMTESMTNLMNKIAPAKGSIIKIDGLSGKYRILSSDGNTMKVYSLQSVGGAQWALTDASTNFNGITGAKYEGSSLDSATESFYNVLPENVKEAIVEQDVYQSMYGVKENYTSKIDPTNKIGDVYVGKRKVTIIDIDEILEYFGSANYSQQEITNLLIPENAAIHVWTRSAVTTHNTFSFFHGNGYYFLFGYSDSCSLNYGIHPVFVLDISKIGWEVIEQ